MMIELNNEKYNYTILKYSELDNYSEIESIFIDDILHEISEKVTTEIRRHETIDNLLICKIKSPANHSETTTCHIFLINTDESNPCFQKIGGARLNIDQYNYLIDNYDSNEIFAMIEMLENKKINIKKNTDYVLFRDNNEDFYISTLHNCVEILSCGNDKIKRNHINLDKFSIRNFYDVDFY